MSLKSWSILAPLQHDFGVCQRVVSRVSEGMESLVCAARVRDGRFQDLRPVVVKLVAEQSGPLRRRQKVGEKQIVAECADGTDVIGEPKTQQFRVHRHPPLRLRVLQGTILVLPQVEMRHIRVQHDVRDHQAADLLAPHQPVRGGGRLPCAALLCTRWVHHRRTGAPAYAGALTGSGT